MSGDTRGSVADEDVEHRDNRPAELTVGEYKTAAIGGVGAYLAGLITTHFIFFQSSGESGFQFGETAVFYAWMHAIVPLKTNAQQFDGKSLVDLGGLPALLTVYLFGFVIILIAFIAGRKMKQSHGKDRVNAKTFTGVFAAAYGLVVFLTANQYTIESTVPGSLVDLGGTTYVVGVGSDTLTMSVDPGLSLVAGLLVGCVFGIFGAQATVGTGKENMERSFGDVDGLSTNPRTPILYLGGIWLVLVWVSM